MSGKSVFARAASSVPASPAEAMSVSSRSKRRWQIENQQSLFCACGLADDTTQPVQEAPHHHADFGIVLDEQYRQPVRQARADTDPSAARLRIQRVGQVERHGGAASENAVERDGTFGTA
jgi:hypothetical protein